MRHECPYCLGDAWYVGEYGDGLSYRADEWYCDDCGNTFLTSLRAHYSVPPCHVRLWHRLQEKARMLWGRLRGRPDDDLQDIPF